MGAGADEDEGEGALRGEDRGRWRQGMTDGEQAVVYNMRL